jgi:excisionase family DNA binding protein
MADKKRKLALSIAELVEVSGLGRSFIYEEIKAGHLVARKAGRRTLILHEDAESWLTSLPTHQPERAQQARSGLPS